VIVPEIITGQRLPAVIEQLLDREHRRLGVQGVEHGLDQQEVGTALEQAPGRVVVVVGERIEADIAVAGVVHVRRDRQGARGRPEHAGAEARLGGILRGVFVAQLAHQARALDVQFVGQISSP
jgi:hypothetical protein